MQLPVFTNIMPDFTIQDSLRFIEVIMITITAIVIITRMIVGSKIEDIISEDKIIYPMALSVVFFAGAGAIVTANIFSQAIPFPSPIEDNLLTVLIGLFFASLLLSLVKKGIGLLLTFVILAVGISIYIPILTTSVLFLIAMGSFMIGLIQLMMDVTEEVRG